jgi:exosome complex component CSL4
MASIRFGRLVLPGERLGVVEEYLPGTGVKALKSGHLVATHLGYAEFDRRNHIVSVRPLRAVRKPSVGDTVLATVREIQEKVIWSDILAILGTKLTTSYSGALLRKGQGLDYVPGDIYLARVVDELSGIYTLSVEGKELGLVQGFCDVCGRPLMLKLNHLECRQCRRSYRKKISIHYQRPEFLKNVPLETWALRGS